MMNTDQAKKKMTVTEYALRFVKESIASYRHDEQWIMGVIVTLPVEAETSLFYLQQHYPSSRVLFELSTDLRFGELLIEKKQ